jgi:uncharacterized protein DUF4177
VTAVADSNHRSEYKIVRATALRKRAGAEEQERLLNELAAEGWHLVDARRADAWDWTWDSTDALVLHRTRVTP